LRFLGTWIPFIREVMSIYSLQQSTKVDFMLKKMIKNSNVYNSKSNNHHHHRFVEVHIIEEIFGVKGLETQQQQQQ
jgi:hypothetical protein